MLAGSGLLLKELDAARFPKTQAVIRDAIRDGVTPGLVAGFWDARIPDEITVTAAGSRRKVPSEQPMEAGTVFDLASLTKIMATSTLAAVLVDRGWIRWDTRLSAILPGYPVRGLRSEIELRHLLSHTAGFIAWRPFWEELRARFGDAARAPTRLHEVPVADRQRAMRELVFSVEPEVAPGTRCLYSDVSFLLLGHALEEVTRMPLDRAVAEFVLKPFGMDGAFYRRVNADPSSGRLDAVAATEDCPWRGGVIQGQVHDDNTWAMGGYAGHAGLFGSIRDVLQFARVLPRMISPRTLREAWTRVDRPPGCPRTLGWDTPSGPDSSAGRYFGPGTVGHLGFTGTSLWLDPSAGLAVGLLTNRVHPSRENIAIRQLRPRLHDALREDLASI